MPGEQPLSDGWSNTDLRTVAGYRLLRRIGEGGMSTVYLSFDVVAGRPVAVKLLADHLTHSREFVSRFYREARLSRLLTHPHLIQGLAAGYDPDSAKHYLILEYVDGPTAHSVLSRLGRFSVGVAVRIGLDIAKALSFMHGRQYVHRDVKPDNILFHPDGFAKLADLGLAKRLNDDAHLTSISQGVGTSYYMSYEQSLNANLVDGRSDIFALGATLYHLLTGEVPFPGATHEEIVRGKEDETHCPLRQRNPEVPAVLADIITRTLARDPRNRFQSVDEFAAALEGTGLATLIPSLPQGDGGDSCSGPDSGSDAPTRADLRTPEENCGSSSMVLPPSVSISKSKNIVSQTPQDKRPNLSGPGTSFILGVMLASAIGLGGMFSIKTSPHSAIAPPPLKNNQESSNPSASSLTPPTQQ